MGYNRDSRRNRGEMIGTIDHAFDDDHPSSHPLIRDDAACAIPWLADGFEAVEVYVDPALTDQQETICDEVNAIAAVQDDLDGLTAEINWWAKSAGLSAGIYERPEGALSSNTVAVVFTIG
jgi:hypothetical protein